MNDIRRTAETDVLARIQAYLHRVDSRAWFAVVVLVGAAIVALVFGGGLGWVIGAVVVAALIVSLEVTVFGAPLARQNGRSATTSPAIRSTRRRPPSHT